MSLQIPRAVPREGSVRVPLPRQTCSAPGRPRNRDQAALNATPTGVNEVFAQSFSAADGWSFEGCQGAAGHTFCSWKRSNGHELRIGVMNAVQGPFFVADQAQFT